METFSLLEVTQQSGELESVRVDLAAYCTSGCPWCVRRRNRYHLVPDSVPDDLEVWCRCHWVQL